MFELFVASRYVVARLIAVISAVAVAFAVVTAYVPNPVFEGFLSELQAKVRGTSAHLLVKTRDPFDADAVAARAKGLDGRILDWSPRVEGQVVFTTGDPVDSFDYGQIVGVDPLREARVSDFGAYLENCGTDADRPFEMKPATLAGIIRRERAEKELGRAALASLAEGERHAALAALGEETGIPYYAPGSPALAAYADRLAAKYAQFLPADEARREADAQAAEKAAEQRVLLEERLVARKGRGAFSGLGTRERKDLLARQELPPGFETTDAFVQRLALIRRRPGVLVGRSLLDTYRDMRIGDEIELLCGSFAGPLEGQKKPKGRNLLAVIVGAYDSELYDFDARSIYMRLSEARTFLDESRPFHGIGFRLADWREAEGVRDALRPHFAAAGFVVMTWKDEKLVIIKAVQRQKSVLFVILFFADLVAGFGIFITLRILVAEKVSDIGVMAALGASPGRVMVAFVITGLAIALAGALAGVGAGVLIVSLSNEIVAGLDWLGFTEFKSYIEETQHLRRIPVEYNVGTLVKTVAATLLTALVSSLYPAYLASRLKPVDAIRREFF